MYRKSIEMLCLAYIFIKWAMSWTNSLLEGFGNILVKVTNLVEYVGEPNIVNYYDL